MCLGLHLATLTHGQQSVKILSLRANVVKQTSCKCFRILKSEMGKRDIQRLFYPEKKTNRLLKIKISKKITFLV